MSKDFINKDFIKGMIAGALIAVGFQLLEIFCYWINW